MKKKNGKKIKRYRVLIADSLIEKRVDYTTIIIIFFFFIRISQQTFNTYTAKIKFTKQTRVQTDKRYSDRKIKNIEKKKSKIITRPVNRCYNECKEKQLMNTSNNGRADNDG